MKNTLRFLATLVPAVLLLSHGAATSHAYAPFQMGIYDPTAAAGAPDGELNFGRMQDAGAGLTRITVEWKEVVLNTPTKPPGFDTRNPADRHYAWDKVDAFVRSANAHGLDPIMTTMAAPTWAEGNSAADRARRQGDGGTYNPNPREYGNFGHALATRYSGTFPDPLNPGRNLPRVRYFQAWNEPNFGQYLSSTSQHAIPRQYARMLNAFYKNVKGVSRSNLVLAAGFGPYGNNGHATDMEPQIFMRELLCLTGIAGRQLRERRRCTVPRPHFDVWSQHPYTFGGTPRTRGNEPDAAAMGNMPDIKRTLAYAVRKRLVLPRGSKQLWSTEMGWFSIPPGLAAGDGRELGLRLERHAEYLSETAYRLWRTGFRAMVWYSVDDQPTFPSGLYLGQGANATPKPALEAFQMPFRADHSKRGVLVWGIARGRGSATVRIERRAGRSWRRVADVRTDRRGMFQRRVRGPRAKYRARVLRGSHAGATSWPFRAR